MGTQSEQQVKHRHLPTREPALARKVMKKRRRKYPSRFASSPGENYEQQSSQARKEAFGERAAHTLRMLRELRSDIENSLSSSSPTVKDPFVRFAESSWSIIDRVELAIEELERGDPRGFEHANEIISLIRN